ncbi:hypothetical protein KBTX_02741 [wastewater metagenome]|uniref:Biopolymer transport protein ExbD/TolR n=2 Tax=unclassified sequences TaxID=12908 RepID=A0A5B8RED5_9ZZZZ|nr:biopolymer transporter ExbD [Arhodomonas aquaeolei]QEA06403.1 hypothetical protein KBTEX_02741 [uncultured organism]
MRIEPPGRRRHAPSLTPLIDVVFILLVFFMLVSRLVDWGRVDVTVSGGGSGGESEVRTAVVRVLPDGATLDGSRYEGLDALAGAVRGADAPATVYLDPAPETRLQRLVSVLEGLRARGVEGVRLLDDDGGR